MRIKEAFNKIIRIISLKLSNLVKVILTREILASNEAWNFNQYIKHTNQFQMYFKIRSGSSLK